MTYRIYNIDGIDERSRSRLERAGIRNTDDLLRRCATPAGRAEASDTTGIDEATLLKWVNVADLMRITGIGAEYAELLDAVGVDTIKELQHRCAPNLAERLRAVNLDRRLTRAVPSAQRVARWIHEANHLPQVICH